MHDWPNIYHHIICIISYFTIYKVKFSLTFPWASQKLLSAAKEHWHNFCIWRHNNCTVIVIVCRYFYKNWEGAAHCIYDLVQSCSAAVRTRNCSVDTDKLYYRLQTPVTTYSIVWSRLLGILTLFLTRTHGRLCCRKYLLLNGRCQWLATPQ